jgi:hypothetical protein
MGSAAGKYKCRKQEIQPYKFYPLPFCDIPDDNYRDGKISRPYQKIADDIQPPVKFGPSAAMPAGRPVRRVKKPAEKFLYLRHGVCMYINLSAKKGSLGLFLALLNAGLRT